MLDKQTCHSRGLGMLGWVSSCSGGFPSFSGGFRHSRVGFRHSRAGFRHSRAGFRHSRVGFRHSRVGGNLVEVLVPAFAGMTFLRWDDVPSLGWRRVLGGRFFDGWRHSRVGGVILA